MADEKQSYGWDGGNDVRPIGKDGLPVAGKDDAYGQMLRRSEQLKKAGIVPEPQWEWQSGCYPVRRRPRAAI